MAKWLGILILAALGGSLAAAVESQRAFDVTVFFSKDDPSWKDAEKIIDSVAKQHPQVRVIKISVDDTAGYIKLTEVEQKLKIARTGDITVILDDKVPITSRDERRDVEVYFEAAVKRVLDAHGASHKGRLAADPAKYAAAIFGAGATLAPTPPQPRMTYHPVVKDGKTAGWVVDIFEPIECPVCNDTQFLAAVSLPDIKVLDVRPVRALERFGLPLGERERNWFLGQFSGFQPVDDSAARKKVDVIVGATRTSHVYERMIHTLLSELKKLEKQ